MPKGRMLNKKISKDIEVARLSCKAALLYSWCIPHLDVEGRIEASPEIIKGVVMPYRKDFTLGVIMKCIEEISRVEGLIVYYGNIHKYMQFLGFSKNQTINKDREAPSEIPPPTPEQLMSNSGETPAKVKYKLNISLSLSIIESVVADLNLILGTSYKPNSQKTQDLIQSRIKEGFTVEDFKTVHRKMLRAWGTDEKMVKYLRPITLYGPKFESYLNQKSVTTKLTPEGVKAYLIGQDWLKSKEMIDVK